MRYLLGTLLLLWVHLCFGQIPNGYYNTAQGLSGTPLRTALHNIIDDHTVISYSGLWDVYEDTDKRSDGKVWDMYSNCSFTFYSDQCGSYNSICDCYNREHTVPQSWFNEASPMVSDIFQVIPTDGKINGYRSDYPYGQCNSGTTYGTGKLGSCTYPGYSGTVFEPSNTYKGDFARIYFYMATRYMDVMSGWDGASFNQGNFSEWTRKMMLDWHHQDPVSQKETDRNNAVYQYQHNRNPFVDHPEYADLIWDPEYNIDVKTTIRMTQIFPNPASDFLFIVAPETYTNLQLSCFNTFGELVVTHNFNSETTIKLDVSNLAPGCYIIKISNETESGYYKIILF